MKRANRLMLVIGVGLAALSFVAVLALGGFGQQQQQATPVPDVPVVVAAADLALGAQVTADNLATTTKPQTEALDTYQDPAQLVGKVVRRAVVAGQVLQTADFETSLTVPELVKSLQPGLRAIAVPLTTVDAVGGLLQGGDFVDVLISLEDGDGTLPVGIVNPYQSPGFGNADPVVPVDDYTNNTSVKVVVQNVQVLASIVAAPTEPTNVVGAASTPQPDVVVLLAVTPQQAEIVRFSQLDGNVSLALRAPADSTAAAIDTSGITLKQLVDQYGVLKPEPVTVVPPVTP